MELYRGCECKYGPTPLQGVYCGLFLLVLLLAELYYLSQLERGGENRTIAKCQVFLFLIFHIN